MKNDNSVNLFLDTVKYLKIVFHLKFSINVNIFIIINWLSAYFFFLQLKPRIFQNRLYLEMLNSMLTYFIFTV